MTRAAVLALFLFGGCAEHFARVDFKYDSNAHLRPIDSLKPFAGTPAQAMERIAAFAAQSGGTITRRGPDHPPQRIEFPPDADEVWRAARALFESEWRSFEKDDPKSYFAIDRTPPVLNRPRLVVKKDGVVESESMRITFPPRQAQQKIVRDLGPLVPVWWTEVHTVNISPVLYAFAWRASDGKTYVYARATPRIGTVEAGAPKAWCNYQLWTASTGYQEALLVRELLQSL